MKLFFVLFFTLSAFTSIASVVPASTKMTATAKDDPSKYCKDSGGKVDLMSITYTDESGAKLKGFTRPFCSFNIDNGIVTVGLETFSSKNANIAASFITTLGPIDESSPLFSGDYSNPSFNVCKNLGGSEVGFSSYSGGFADALGESDICVFGDGSMVSAWSLIYIANGRNGYDAVKKAIRSKPIKLLY